MDGRDCAFHEGAYRFRYRAGAIILEDGCVLMVKNDVKPYYYSVGGAVQMGESAAEAAVREAYEETGVRYEVDRLQFVHENFFQGTDAVSGDIVFCHEISLYFLMKPKGIRKFAVAPAPNVGLERMVWIPIAEYQNHRAYPAFFGERLKDLKDHVEHIATREQMCVGTENTDGKECSS